MATVPSESRILIVDDEDANVRLMAHVLQSAGYANLREITDAREVLAEVQEWDPDLVLLDLRMPHIDGFSLLQALREQTSPGEFVPILVLTADAQRETLKRALTAGANDFLTKPLDIDEVVLRVRNLLAIRLSHESLKRTNVALARTLRDRMRSDQEETASRDDRAAAMRAMIATGPTMVFQPVVELATRRVVGVEALSRFDAGGPPDHWFAEATALGLGADLELAAVSVALEQLGRLDAGVFMAVNVSPAVLLDRRLQDLARIAGGGQVVIEVTEHHAVDDYDGLNLVCAALRRDGIRLAVDDAGAGYASLHHILKLSPDIIKLDMALTRDIDSDPVKRAMAASLVQFAQETNATVIAEGIETAAEFETLRSLGAPWGQGFHIGRPEPFGVPARPGPSESLPGIVRRGGVRPSRT